MTTCFKFKVLGPLQFSDFVKFLIFCLFKLFANEAPQLKLVYFCVYTEFSLVLYLVHALGLSRKGVSKVEVPLTFTIIGSEV